MGFYGIFMGFNGIYPLVNVFIVIVKLLIYSRFTHDLPMKHGDFPWLCFCLPEGSYSFKGLENGPRERDDSPSYKPPFAMDFP